METWDNLLSKNKEYVKDLVKWFLQQIPIDNYDNPQLYIIILDKLDLKNINRELIIECIDGLVKEYQIQNIINDSVKQTEQKLIV